DSYAVGEGAGSATVTVIRTGDTGTALSVRYVSRDGTATAGSDYLQASGQLDFAPGEASKTFTVTVVQDNLREGPETARLELSGPAVADTALLTILDDELT